MQYNVMYNVGKCKYIVNHHDGIKTHPDGSQFFDCKIFKNKVKLAGFIQSLVDKGYKEV